MILTPHRIFTPEKVLLLSGLFVSVLGATVLVGWMLDITALKSVFPGLVTMKANTAMGMLLCGGALMLLSRGKVARPIRLSTAVMAVVVIAMGTLTLGEYLLGLEFGIDQMLFHDAANPTGISQPGRMSPATAFCFVLAGCSLWMAARSAAMRLRLPILAALGISVIVVGGLALIGYVTDVLFGLRWWNYTGMAIHTAAGFVLLGCGLLALVKGEGGLRWSLDTLTTGGFVLGIVSLIAAAGISYHFTNQLQQSAGWVSHTQEVLKEIEEVSAGVAALGSSQRNYINTGNEHLLEQEKETTDAIHENLGTVRKLDADNPTQQHRLDQLESLISQRIEWGEQTVVARRQEGLPAAEQIIIAGRGIMLSDNIRHVTKEIEGEEYFLLDQREKKEQAISTTTFLLLPLGVFLSLTLLSLVLFFLNAGVGERMSAEEALRKSKAQLQTIVENLTEGVAVSDLNGQLLHFNRAALDIHGFASMDECLRHLTEFVDTFELSDMDGAVWPVDQWPLARILRGEKLCNLEVRIRRIQTDWRRIFNYGGTLVHDSTGRPLMAVVAISDITERKRAEEEIQKLNADLEQRVAIRTVELEAANKELEAFSYSVSHDLRAPLRAVDGFSQAVEEDYGTQLPEEGRRYLQAIREGAQQMGVLIDDLLTFSRLSRQPVTEQMVNTAKLVNDVIEELNPRQQGRQVEIRIGELPSCRGDAALLKQVWINLLSNAFKYSSNRNPAVIEIGCELEQGENVYFVRDNGAGFDMQYAHKLFGVFQRLHRADEFEGTGVGLAILQRIVHRHGGRVWAEAALDRGATFYFTLKGETKL